MKYSLWRTKTIDGFEYDEQVGTLDADTESAVAPEELTLNVKAERELTAEELKHLTWLEWGKNERHI